MFSDRFKVCNIRNVEIQTGELRNFQIQSWDYSWLLKHNNLNIQSTAASASFDLSCTMFVDESTSPA